MRNVSSMLINLIASYTYFISVVCIFFTKTGSFLISIKKVAD